MDWSKLAEAAPLEMQLEAATANRDAAVFDLAAMPMLKMPAMWTGAGMGLRFLELDGAPPWVAALRLIVAGAALLEQEGVKVGWEPRIWEGLAAGAIAAGARVNAATDGLKTPFHPAPPQREAGGP